MARFRIKRASLARLLGNIKKVDERTQKRLAMALGMWADDLVGEIGQELLHLGAIDQGILYAATTRSEVRLEGTRLRVVIFNPTEYAVIVEFGRQPASGKPPPLLPLVGWAARRGIVKSLPRNISFGGGWEDKWAASGAILRNLKKGARKGSDRPKKPIDPEVLDLLKVRLIAQKIYEQGIAARHPFSIAFDRKSRTFASDISAIMGR